MYQTNRMDYLSIRAHQEQIKSGVAVTSHVGREDRSERKGGLYPGIWVKVIRHWLTKRQKMQLDAECALRTYEGSCNQNVTY